MFKEFKNTIIFLLVLFGIGLILYFLTDWIFMRFFSKEDLAFYSVISTVIIIGLVYSLNRVINNYEKGINEEKNNKS